MIRIAVDCNWREDTRTIVIPHEDVPESHLRVGAKVTLHEPGMECEAILRHGKQWPWVADIIEGTIKNEPYDE